MAAEAEASWCLLSFGHKPNSVGEGLAKSQESLGSFAGSVSSQRQPHVEQAPQQQKRPPSTVASAVAGPGLTNSYATWSGLSERLAWSWPVPEATDSNIARVL